MISNASSKELKYKILGSYDGKSIGTVELHAVSMAPGIRDIGLEWFGLWFKDIWVIYANSL